MVFSHKSGQVVIKKMKKEIIVINDLSKIYERLFLLIKESCKKINVKGRQIPNILIDVAPAEKKENINIFLFDGRSIETKQ